MTLPLVEALTYDQAGIRTQLVENASGGKDLYMEGIFIQGGVKNKINVFTLLTKLPVHVVTLQRKLKLVIQY